MSEPKSVCELSESTSSSLGSSIASFQSPRSTLSYHSIRGSDDSLDGSASSRNKRSSPARASPSHRKKQTEPDEPIFDFDRWSKSQIDFFNEVDNFPLQIEFDNIEEKKRRKERLSRKRFSSVSDEGNRSYS
ncbi:hypothetical protein WA588_002293, partial [Blastocystis sp. NMH]